MTVCHFIPRHLLLCPAFMACVQALGGSINTLAGTSHGVHAFLLTWEER